MWQLMKQRYNWNIGNLFDCLMLDMANTFYVGDAAGRLYKNGRKDHSDSDILFAKAIECEFMTPEQFYQKYSIF
jgi:bifunctional polynucleotide phosphatase/kinase